VLKGYDGGSGDAGGVQWGGAPVEQASPKNLSDFYLTG